MTVVDAVTDVVTPIAESLGLEIYDIDMAGPILRVSLDRAGGVDLDSLAEANRLIGAELDLIDPVPGRYTLEVSSPGLERRLRTEEHWQGAVGDRVKVKMSRRYEGERRIDGVVVGITSGSIEIAPDPVDSDHVVVPIDLVESARTAFDMAPTPKPGSPEHRKLSATPPTSQNISSEESEAS